MNFLRLLYKKIYQKLNYDVQKALLLNGKILSNQNNGKQQIKSLDEVEFQVFSQRGEDGIIQYIINKIEIPYPIFVEFGVETYTESNTRFLLFNNNWSGLVIDGSAKNVDFIRKDLVYWKYDLVALNSFITRENINNLISSYTKVRDIGLLSVDIDGNDYWIWECIDCINPRIVICEYNSAFGGKKKVTVPYKADFVRSREHHSELYFGASLAAFCDLAEKKGYDFIGTTRAGVNAYFVRKDLSAPFLKYDAQTGFNESANRDSKNEKGELLFLRHHERLDVIRELPVFDIEKQQLTKISDINWS
ncbi:hypothetical protein HYN48_03650 [Flavobacterium magnum]|uniref:Uncharacterized protein n=1 Tax=Flavobacterium magnum TaxID=2162713 RepID=A0A2S0RC14_9FLAO|nr:hypothetical protein [Flavobacterium magnum]AWA29253.1 hypothetical protein HYN48_03650 [Flavobacterium magnum]